MRLYLNLRPAEYLLFSLVRLQVRMLNSFQLPGASDVDLYPPCLAPQIDALNDTVYNQAGRLGCYFNKSH